VANFSEKRIWLVSSTPIAMRTGKLHGLVPGIQDVYGTELKPFKPIED
jgi:hypothetical protein